MNRRRQNDAQLVVRLPEELLTKLDAHADRLRAEQPGPAWSRADVVRLLLTRALDAEPPAKPRRRSS